MSESSNSSGENSGFLSSLMEQLPLDELKDQAVQYAGALKDKAVDAVGDQISGLTDKLTDVASGGGGIASGAAAESAKALAEGESPVKAGLGGVMGGAKDKVSQAFGGEGGGGGGGGGGQKFTNIVETNDVGVPLSVAYNQWTQFQDWTDFMKKVESVEQESEEKLNFKGQVFLSHRTWEATITQQVPDEQIVWESEGSKGYLNGSVTFHELGPRLTRILAVVEYHPVGFVEKTANLWRPVGRRVRVEFKRYVHHVMTSTILDEESVEGWRGEIRESEVVRSHEEALEAEQDEGGQEESEESTDDPASEPMDSAEAEDGGGTDSAEDGDDQDEDQGVAEDAESEDDGSAASESAESDEKESAGTGR